jgi:3-hydroxy-9,10-secoandrosta-1,3,5(10)-triene-9,17-dione monooxygenase reductase component
LSQPIQHSDEHFRSVLGHFASGVAVVTAISDGTPVGMTIQSFCSLSLDPPLILLCPARTSTSWPRIDAVGDLCVNLLKEGDEYLARKLAESGTAKFDEVAWSPSELTGSPILDGNLAWIDCRISQTYSGGDHMIVVCEVLALSARTNVRPLIFFQSTFQRIF